VAAVAHGTAGRALVLGTDKEVRDVTLTPAHAWTPWRELLPAARQPTPPVLGERGR